MIALQVLDKSGYGSLYDVKAAIEYAVHVIEDNSLDPSDSIINLSIGGDYNNDLDLFLKGFANKGIRFSVAAGNDGKDVDRYSPASAGDISNIFTVSAVDHQNRMASFSNWDDLFG